jgi:hypothetical protein
MRCSLDSQDDLKWLVHETLWEVGFRCHPIKQSIAVSIHSSMALQTFVGPWPLLQFRNHFYTDGRTPRTSDQPVAVPLRTHRTTQTQNKRTHRHPCLEWDSNSRFQRSSERRQSMP